MRFAPLPNIDYLRSRLRYEPDTGNIYWLERPRDQFTKDYYWRIWNDRYLGKVAGTIALDGYVRLHFDRLFYGAHRIAWAIYTGSAPTGVMDHINGIRTDNRIANLRDVTFEQNCKNLRGRRHNKSGRIGVSWSSRQSRWIAFIGNGGKQEFLGQFINFEDAVAARKAAEVRLGYHPNHGLTPSQIEEGK